MERRTSRRGSLLNALSSIENLHKFVPGSISRAFSSQSREQSDVSDNEEFWPEVRSSEIPVEEFAKNEHWKRFVKHFIAL